MITETKFRTKIPGVLPNSRGNDYLIGIFELKNKILYKT